MYELDKTKFGAFVARLRREKSILRKSWPHPSKECPPLFVLLRFCRHMKKGMAKSRPYPFFVLRISLLPRALAPAVPPHREKR